MTSETQTAATVEIPAVAAPRSPNPTARLILRDELGQVIQQWLIKQNKCTLGSAANCSLRCTAPGIAPYHALIVVGARQTFLRALAPKVTRDGVQFTEMLLTDTSNHFEICGHRFELARNTAPAASAENSSAGNRLKFTLARPFALSAKPSRRPDAGSPPSSADVPPGGAAMSESSSPAARNAHTSSSEVALEPARAADSQWVAELMRTAVEPLESQIQSVLEPLAQLQSAQRKQQRLRRKRLEERKRRQTERQRLEVEAEPAGPSLPEQLDELAARQSAAMEILSERISDVNHQLCTIERIVNEERLAASQETAIQKNAEVQRDSQIAMQAAAVEQLQHGIVAVSTALSDLQIRQADQEQRDGEWKSGIHEKLDVLQSAVRDLNERSQRLQEQAAPIGVEEYTEQILAAQSAQNVVPTWEWDAQQPTNDLVVTEPWSEELERQVAQAAEEARAEKVAQAELKARAEREAQAAEAQRIAEAERLAEAERTAELERVAEAARLAEAERLVELEREAEEKRIAEEAERIEAERAEAERAEAERIEAERIEAERIEAERIEAERIEAERIEAERIEAERIEAERIEAERIEAERIEAERIEAERIEAERIEAERIEAERIEAEAEVKRLAEVEQVAEAERVAQAEQAAELERTADAQQQAEAGQGGQADRGAQATGLSEAQVFPENETSQQALQATSPPAETPAEWDAIDQSAAPSHQTSSESSDSSESLDEWADDRPSAPSSSSVSGLIADEVEEQLPSWWMESDNEGSQQGQDESALAEPVEPESIENTFELDTADTKFEHCDDVLLKPTAIDEQTLADGESSGFELSSDKPTEVETLHHDVSPSAGSEWTTNEEVPDNGATPYSRFASAEGRAEFDEDALCRGVLSAENGEVGHNFPDSRQEAVAPGTEEAEEFLYGGLEATPEPTALRSDPPAHEVEPGGAVEDSADLIGFDLASLESVKGTQRPAAAPDMAASIDGVEEDEFEFGSPSAEPDSLGSESSEIPRTLEEELDQRGAQLEAEAAAAQEEADDESVEDYMRRLMARMRGVPEDQVELPKSASRQPPPREFKSQGSSAESAPTTGPEQTATPEGSSVEGEKKPMPLAETAPFDPEKYVPRVVSPQLSQDFAAMRELANSSARTAISKSTRSKVLAAVALKAIVSIIGMVVAGVLIAINGFNVNIGLVATVAAMLVAVIWGFDAITSLKPLLSAGLVLKPPASTEATQDGDGESA